MKTLIVDDHALFRQGLVSLLRELPEFSAILEADGVQSAQEMADAHADRLCLILLDHTLPDGDGIELLKEMRIRHPLLPVAIISAHEDFELMQQAIDAGAVGFIPKSMPTSVVIQVVKLLLAGGIYIPPKLYRMMTQQNREAATERILTHRQEEVMHLIQQGCSNKEIAYQLGITEATVKAHVTAILKARGVSSRSMLLALARDE